MKPWFCSDVLKLLIFTFAINLMRKDNQGLQFRVQGSHQRQETNFILLKDPLLLECLATSTDQTRN